MPDNDLQIENRIYRLRISRYRRFLFLLLGAGVLAVLLTGYFLIWNRVRNHWKTEEIRGARQKKSAD